MERIKSNSQINYSKQVDIDNIVSMTTCGLIGKQKLMLYQVQPH